MPEAIICSGERDSLCVRSLGYFPLWFNSETYQVSEQEMKMITRLVDKVYNIPDIDTTGKLKGRHLALKYLDIHTIWLPEKLSLYKDNRGKPRKDFRDWMEIWDKKQNFRDLLELATPAKFWIVEENEKTGKTNYQIDVFCLREFLQLNGFYCLKDDHNDKIPFIRIEGNVVSVVTEKNIRDFVLRWAMEHSCPRSLRNLIIKTTYLNRATLEVLEETSPDFSTATETSQYFYIGDFAYEITADGICKIALKSGTLEHYVWKDRIIRHPVKLVPDVFRITHPEGDYTSGSFDIEVLNNRSKYFRYLINGSRVYWREELETRLETMSAADAARYKEDHKFDIAGPLLTSEEIAEQKQSLINKIFTIGYMLHRYKLMSRAWAPFITDNLIGENGVCNGGSGKSLMIWALSRVCNYLKLSGRDPKLLENRHVFENVSEKRDIVLIDDCHQYFDYEAFYDTLTSDITINPKMVSSYQLPYDKAPKFAFTTNYAPRELSGSSERRRLFVTFSDYYHSVSENNNYRETRQVRNDFGMDLFGNCYPDADWDADINFMMQCVKFYLSIAQTTAKIEPKLDNIIYRKYLQDMTANFREWAEGYFAIDEDGTGEHVDKMIVRETAFEDYRRFSGTSKVTMNSFTRALKAYCYVTDAIDCLNPEEFHNSNGRILKRVPWPTPTSPKIQKEMIYVQTIQGAKHAKEVQEVNSIVNTPGNSWTSLLEPPRD